MKIHPRLYKEARALFWPWCAGMLPMFLPSSVPSWLPNRLYWLQDLPGICVLFGSLLLAALSFGEEFQCRTLPMLLSQPCSRLRLWSEKMLVLLAFLIPLFLGFAVREWILAWKLYGSLFSHPLSPVFDMSIVLACTMGYWTLFVRSTLGGMVLSLASWGAVTMTVTFAVGKIWEGQPLMVEGLTPLAMSVVGLAYAGLFLWLGWWKFSRLELNTSDGGESGLSASAGADVPVATVLRIRASSPIANLVRKELRLLRPLLVFALIFALFWLALTLFVKLLPRQTDGADLLLGVVTACYMALSLLLAGCLPLCEERSLGLHLANLTLPVPVRVQWRLKLLVALAVGLALGVVLPFVLSLLTAGAMESPLPGFIFGRGHFDLMDGRGRLFGLIPVLFLNNRQDAWMGFALLGLLVLLGFWSATRIQRVTHAILLAIFALAALQVACVLGALGGNWVVAPFREGSTWLMELTTWMMVRFQMTSSGFSRFSSMPNSNAFVFWPIMGTALVLTGIQSWRAYRTLSTGWGRSLAKMGLTVALVAGLIAAVQSGSNTVWTYMGRSPLMLETRTAFIALKLPPVGEAPKITSVSLAELEATGKLSAQSKAWLKNAKLEIAVSRQNYRIGPGPGSPPVIHYSVYANVLFSSRDRLQILIHRETYQP